MNTNMEVRSRSFDVINGPGAGCLFDACKYAYDNNARVPVNFAVAIGYTMPRNHPGSAYICASMRNVRIVGIEHEDGSGNSFNLKGYCDVDLRPGASTHL